MSDENPIYEVDKNESQSDPDEVPIRDRRLITQPYDLVIESLIDQIKGGTIYLRELSDRPSFQRRYVWTDVLASRLIESILLNVPIPPCYLSQNDNFELDVIDGQQRLFSIYRFMENQFSLTGLKVFTELNKSRFHKIPDKLKKKLLTHTLRLVAITNDSHPEIKFDVFERLNSNTAPLNAQELRNCIYRGSLNSLLGNVVEYKPWLMILGNKKPDKRMRHEELALRFFAFFIHGLKSYRTPQKHWLNDAAQKGMKYSKAKIDELEIIWNTAIDKCLILFEPDEAFRRLPLQKSRKINRALFDLIMYSTSLIQLPVARSIRKDFRSKYMAILENEEFIDLISRAVDHTKRTKKRFAIWNETFGEMLRLP